jgi:hypothetical protein
MVSFNLDKKCSEVLLYSLYNPEVCHLGSRNRLGDSRGRDTGCKVGSLQFSDPEYGLVVKRRATRVWFRRIFHFYFIFW